MFRNLNCAMWKIYHKLFYKLYVLGNIIYAIPLWLHIFKNISKKTVVFEARDEMHWLFVKPVIDKLLNNYDINIVIAAGGYIEGGNTYLNTEDKIYYLLRNDKKYKNIVWHTEAVRFIRADVFVSTHPGGNPFPFGAKRIQMFHGFTGFTNVVKRKPYLNFDYFFLSGHYIRENFDERVIKKYGYMKRLVPCNIGYPKLDIFFEKYVHQQKNGEKSNDFGDYTKPTIIYAPAWGKNSSLHLYGENLVENLLDLDINLYVKLHSWSMYVSEITTDGIDWTKRFSRFNSKNNFHFIETKNAVPYFSCSDIMISDVSGVSLEFMAATKRPVILINVPETKGSHWDEAKRAQWYKCKLHQEMRKVSICVDDGEEAISAVKSVLKNPNPGQEQRDRFSEQILYNSGNAAKCAADKIVEIMKGNF